MDPIILIHHWILSMEKMNMRWKPSWPTGREEDKCSTLSSGEDMTQVTTHGNLKQISQTQMKFSLDTKDRETLTETIAVFTLIAILYVLQLSTIYFRIHHISQLYQQTRHR